MTATRKKLVAVLLLITISCPAQVLSCGEVNLKKPPCSVEYHEEYCNDSMPDGSFVVEKECVKTIQPNVFESWEFWLGISIFLLCIVCGIGIYKCIRGELWYKHCKDEIRHEQNRKCARFCVNYICRCKTCVKCCERYTSPTTREEMHQQKEMPGYIDLTIPYHERHHNYRLEPDKAEDNPKPASEHPEKSHGEQKRVSHAGHASVAPSNKQ